MSSPHVLMYCPVLDERISNENNRAGGSGHDFKARRALELGNETIVPI
jgi:hypothetical protein